MAAKVELRHLVQLLRVVEPQYSKRAADGWRQDTMGDIWLTRPPTIFVAKDFLAHWEVFVAKDPNGRGSLWRQPMSAAQARISSQ